MNFSGDCFKADGSSMSSDPVDWEDLARLWQGVFQKPQFPTVCLTYAQAGALSLARLPEGVTTLLTLTTDQVMHKLVSDGETPFPATGVMPLVALAGVVQTLVDLVNETDSRVQDANDPGGVCRAMPADLSKDIGRHHADPHQAWWVARLGDPARYLPALRVTFKILQAWDDDDTTAFALATWALQDAGRDAGRDDTTPPPPLPLAVTWHVLAACEKGTQHVPPAAARCLGLALTACILGYGAGSIAAPHTTVLTNPLSSHVRYACEKVFSDLIDSAVGMAVLQGVMVPTTCLLAAAGEARSGPVSRILQWAEATPVDEFAVPIADALAVDDEKDWQYLLNEMLLSTSDDPLQILLGAFAGAGLDTLPPLMSGHLAVAYIKKYKSRTLVPRQLQEVGKVPPLARAFIHAAMVDQEQSHEGTRQQIVRLVLQYWKGSTYDDATLALLDLGDWWQQLPNMLSSPLYRFLTSRRSHALTGTGMPFLFDSVSEAIAAGNVPVLKDMELLVRNRIAGHPDAPEAQEWLLKAATEGNADTVEAVFQWHGMEALWHLAAEPLLDRIRSEPGLTKWLRAPHNGPIFITLVRVVRAHLGLQKKTALGKYMPDWLRVVGPQDAVIPTILQTLEDPFCKLLKPHALQWVAAAVCSPAIGGSAGLVAQLLEAVASPTIRRLVLSGSDESRSLLLQVFKTAWSLLKQNIALKSLPAHDSAIALAPLMALVLSCQECKRPEGPDELQAIRAQVGAKVEKCLAYAVNGSLTCDTEIAPRTYVDPLHLGGGMGSVLALVSMLQSVRDIVKGITWPDGRWPDFGVGNLLPLWPCVCAKVLASEDVTAREAIVADMNVELRRWWRLPGEKASHQPAKMLARILTETLLSLGFSVGAGFEEGKHVMPDWIVYIPECDADPKLQRQYDLIGALLPVQKTLPGRADLLLLDAMVGFVGEGGKFEIMIPGATTPVAYDWLAHTDTIRALPSNLTLFRWRRVHLYAHTRLDCTALQGNYQAIMTQACVAALKHKHRFQMSL